MIPLAAAFVFAAAAAPTLTVQTGHSLPVVAVALSRDESLLATGSRDGTAILWDRRGYKLREIRAEPLGVSAIALSPDARFLLTGGAGTAKLWDAATGKLLRKVGTPGEFLVAVLFTPDGKSILTAGDDGAVKFWDAATGRRQRVYGPAPSRLTAAALSKDGKRLAYAAGGPDIWIWDLESGAQTQQLVGDGPWTSLAFSPDGRRLASGTQDSVRVWDTARGRDILSFKGNAGRALAFTADGRSILSCGGSNTARLWDAGSGRPLRSLIGHLDAVDSIALGESGKLAVTGSEDHSARLWELGSGRASRVFAGAGLPVLFAAVSSDGRRLLTVDPQKAALWDVESGKPVSVSTGDWEGTSRLAASRDLRWLAFVHDREEVGLRDLSAPREPASARWSQIRAHALALDPSGRFLVSARDEGLQAWDIPAATERTKPAEAGRAGWLGLGLDGRRLVTRGLDGAVELWDLEGGRRIARFKFEGAALPDLALSRDGRFLAAGAPAPRGRYALSVRGLSDGEELRTWQADTVIEPYAFGPAGDTLLVLSGGGAWEWDLGTGRKKNAFQPPTEAAFDWPDAVDPAWRYLLARKEDGVSVVSMAGGKELGLLRLSEKGWVVTAPDGRIDAAPEAVRWTEGLKSEPLEKFAGGRLSRGLLGKLLLGETE